MKFNSSIANMQEVMPGYVLNLIIHVINLNLNIPSQDFDNIVLIQRQ